MGWEYFNSLPGEAQKPWQWAAEMSLSMGMKEVVTAAQMILAAGAVRNSLLNLLGGMGNRG